MAVDEAVFSVTHHQWNRLGRTLLGAGVVIRRLRGGSCEAWKLDLEQSAGVVTRGVAAEGLLSILAGRVRCVIFGNEVELPAGSFALVPPNTPFELRTAGRAPAELLCSFSRVLSDALPIDAL